MEYTELIQEIRNNLETNTTEQTIKQILDALELIAKYIDRQTDPELWHPRETYL